MRKSLTLSATIAVLGLGACGNEISTPTPVTTQLNSIAQQLKQELLATSTPLCEKSDRVQEAGVAMTEVARSHPTDHSRTTLETIRLETVIKFLNYQDGLDKFQAARLIVSGLKQDGEVINIVWGEGNMLEYMERQVGKKVDATWKLFLNGEAFQCGTEKKPHKIIKA